MKIYFFVLVKNTVVFNFYNIFFDFMFLYYLDCIKMTSIKKHPKPSNDFECKGTAFFADMQIF